MSVGRDLLLTPVATIPWSHIEHLGGPQKGDPHIENWSCLLCSKIPGFHADREPCLSCPKLLSGGEHVAVLPEGGFGILRVLWRHKGASMLAPLEVPHFIYRQRQWALRVAGGATVWLAHGHISDPCEALATIVADEVDKLSSEDPDST